MKIALLKTSFFLSLLLFCGWGGTGHKIINRKTTESFPTSMQSFMYWTPLLENHASDADDRKNADPNESPRHFIDIDEYPEFVLHDTISQSYEFNVGLHGSYNVIDWGILPWAIIRTVDSLKLAFEQRNWDKAVLKAADLGHYVGDGHMPLHITKNYNGQITGQTGVHSRYESTMIGKFYQQITYTNDTASYVNDKSNYVFNFIYTDYKYVDSVLQADLKAKLVTGSTSSTAYYDSLWFYTQRYTTTLFKNASKRLADLIYTAWIDAGRPDPNVTPVELVSFYSLIKDGKVELNWATSTETNNKGYEILRSSDINGSRSDWQTVGYIAGKGTTTLEQNYSFIDNYSSQTGKYYYKLKQIDLNGNYELSNEIEVNIAASFTLNQNYPNPFNPTTKITFQLPVKSEVTVKLYDLLGKEVETLYSGVTSPGIHEVTLNASSLPSGMYIYKLQTQYFSQSKKLLLMK